MKSDKSFQKAYMYDRCLAKVQIQISKKHRELKDNVFNENNTVRKQHILYAELLMQHWGM